MTAERPGVTLADIRAAARDPINGGILMGGWSAEISEKPLPQALQEMADDISSWFNPSQGWRLAEVSTGFINPQRIEGSSVDANLRKTIVAKRQEPDQFVVNFHFDADNPPTKGQGFLGSGRKRLDFLTVFSQEFQRNVRIFREGNADVVAHKIGSVFPLKEAIDQLNCPYYLNYTTVSANRRKLANNQWSAEGLVVSVHMKDLGDYLKLEVARLQKAGDIFEGKFLQAQSSQNTAA